MQVKVKARYGIIGKTITDTQEISTRKELSRSIASVVTSSQAWFNDIQVVTNGCVELFTYNRAEELLAYLRGDSKEFNVIDNTVRPLDS